MLWDHSVIDYIICKKTRLEVCNKLENCVAVTIWADEPLRVALQKLLLKNGRKRCECEPWVGCHGWANLGNISTQEGSEGFINLFHNHTVPPTYVAHVIADQFMNGSLNVSSGCQMRWCDQFFHTEFCKRPAPKETPTLASASCDEIDPLGEDSLLLRLWVAHSSCLGLRICFSSL